MGPPLCVRRGLFGAGVWVAIAAIGAPDAALGQVAPGLTREQTLALLHDLRVYRENSRPPNQLENNAEALARRIVVSEAINETAASPSMRRYLAGASEDDVLRIAIWANGTDRTGRPTAIVGNPYEIALKQTLAIRGAIPDRPVTHARDFQSGPANR